MNNDMYSGSPMGESSLPFKDLDPDMPVTPAVEHIKPVVVSQPKQASSLKVYLIILGIAVGLLFIMLLAVLVLVLQRPKVVAGPQPTNTPRPTGTPAPSVISQDLVNRINKLEQDTSSLDLQELDVTYPQITWKIRFN